MRKARSNWLSGVLAGVLGALALLSSNQASTLSIAAFDTTHSENQNNLTFPPALDTLSINRSASAVASNSSSGRFVLDSIATFSFSGPGSDCWAWIAPNGDDYAIMGVGEGLVFINATTLTICDTIPTSGCTWQDMMTVGHYLYSVSECDDGLQVIDLQFLPDSAHFITSLPVNNTGGLSSHNLCIDTTRNFLYLEGDAVGFNIHIHDISNPELPVYVASFGDFDFSIHDMYVINDTAFVADGTASPASYSIWDMADKFAPKLITRWLLPGGFSHNIWPNASRSLVATTQESPGETVKIWNIVDPANVVLVGAYSGPAQFAHNAHFKGQDVYLSEYVDGVAVIRLCGDGVEELATFTTPDRDNPSITADCWGVNPFTSDSLVYMSLFDGRLIILRLREDTGVPITDADSDGARDGCDNCTELSNPDQADEDGDLIGDACDSCPNDFANDADGDGVCSKVDNCPNAPNSGQEDNDGDGVGDVCDICLGNDDNIDSDLDGIPDGCDTCPNDPDNDADGDGACGDVDNCILPNPDQLDTDSDGLGDLCDACPLDSLNDVDGDLFCGDIDNCPSTANTFQFDSDNDGIGDACDECPGDNINDPDGDGLCATVDNCPTDANADQTDSDGDGIGDVCDLCEGFDDTQDSDSDGIPDGCDDCPLRPDPCSCCNVSSAGDANHDGFVNIADVTFLIARIFAGGEAPVCNDDADADGNNKVNIADVTFLIARIFASGPAPVCGTTGI